MTKQEARDTVARRTIIFNHRTEYYDNWANVQLHYYDATIPKQYFTKLEDEAMELYAQEKIKNENHTLKPLPPNEIWIKAQIIQEEGINDGKAILVKVSRIDHPTREVDILVHKYNTCKPDSCKSKTSTISDDEIDTESQKRYGEIKGGSYHADRPHDRALFSKGAKWMRDKLTKL